MGGCLQQGQASIHTSRHETKPEDLLARGNMGVKAERSVRPDGTVGRIASGLASSIDGSVVASDGATSSNTSLDSSCSGRGSGRDDARGLVNNRARGGRGQAFDGSGNTSAGLSIESLSASQPAFST